MNIIITGGGSGGHVMPALAIIEELRNSQNAFFKDVNILYVGSKKGIEKKLIEKKGVKFKSIYTGKLRRYFSLQNVSDIFRTLFGIVQSVLIINKFSPDIIFSTGGFVSVPVVIAGKIKNIPILIHEQTVDAGLANKIAGRFAQKVAITFPESGKYFQKEKIVLTGIPIRKEIFQGSKESGYKRFGFDLNIPTIFFTGGGLGCHVLNEAAMSIIPDLLKKSNIIYQTGAAMNGQDFRDMKNLRESLPDYLQKRFYLTEFINEEIAEVFALADLAVARSGAGTVNELLTMKIPAIFIPLAIATNNEQLKNALITVNLGGAEVIEEKELNSALLLDKIEDILFTEKITVMKRNLSETKFENGVDKVIGVMENILKNSIK
ncbi:MAG TPA: undecaprenyldiphospho-muramoylpentapeptide beta-N-acetylglucosaminyltransferase [Spirochaetota bacterium]|nr:undecaprenyldiphospho-muramoylpentapeptide beta-N-acetylglucosaminyltransferase [Spirochaetota bacterium]HOS31908.1 undecaprenyldiphospho-muramoylpentapeptide beta-N-acetylglucosaminyltransferase [Spirochaetota bacterium]HOS54495.1 undecaprenyldiphospho-muramoylpentapeptide beta-N-acetylglucosaminyltransferase [Spirochaetota bacterium]HPK62653.1 undecaprenyldiphospho-muramoylpentapeptide beta-N-acetylglucosaminyltransferase [Spirochaetota bacterium]HQF76988.1 undecaprenyldiphospho-muramoylpe